MPTLREVDVFQKVGKVALAYTKLPSFSEIASHVLGIHSPFLLRPPHLPPLTNMIFSAGYISFKENVVDSLMSRRPKKSY